MSHEQSETIQRPDGKWINVYGSNLPQAGIQLPGSGLYSTVEEAVAAAKARSASFDDDHTLLSTRTRMGDTRRTRDYEPGLYPQLVQFPSDPYISPNSLGGPGMGGAGNEGGMGLAPQAALGGVDQRLASIQQLGDQRRGLEDQLASMQGQPSTRLMTTGEMWQGLKDIGSSGLDLLGRGAKAILPTQEGWNEGAMRLQNANAIVNGGTPLWMMQQQHQVQLGQHQELMAMKRQQMATELQRANEQRRQHDLQLLERAIANPRASTLLEQLGQDPNYSMASQAKMLHKGLKDADYSSFAAYREFIPPDVQERFMQGQLPQHELNSWLDMAREDAKVNAKAQAKSMILSRATNKPADQRTPFEQQLVEEHEAQRELNKLKADETRSKTEENLAQAAKYRKEAEGTGYKVSPVVDSISHAFHGKSYAELPEGGPEQRDVMNRYSQLYAAGRNVVDLGSPAPVDKRSDVINRTDFLKSGALNRPAAGISKGDLAKGDYIQLSDTQQKLAADVDKAGSNLKQLFGIVMPMIKAKTPMDAAKQFTQLHGGAFMGTNPDAATYKAGSEAFSSQLARVFGGEVGVMTNQDITRWQNTLPSFGDTKQVAERKQKLFFEIYDNAVQAFRNQVAGVKGDNSKLQDLLSKADQFKSATPDQGTKPTIEKVPTLSSKEEYDKLPSGSLYKKADGKVRRKP